MKNSIIIVILGILVNLFLNSCIFIPSYNPKHYGDYGCRTDIKQSKESEVFIAEYYVPGNKILAGTFELMVKEAWIEKPWFYNNWSRPIIDEDTWGYKLCLRFKNQLPKLKNDTLYYFNMKSDIEQYSPGLSSNRSITPTNGVDLYDYSKKAKDTLRVRIIRRHYKSHYEDTIASFKCIRKQN